MLQCIRKEIAPLYQEKIAVQCQEFKGINEQFSFCLLSPSSFTFFLLFVFFFLLGI